MSRKQIKRSKEFLEGYNASAAAISRSRNPYLGKLVFTPETPEQVEDNRKYEDWRDGWRKRFHGEDINSAP